MKTSSPTHHPFISPGIVLVIGILAVSTASIMIRFAQQHAPSLVIAAYRLAFATLAVAPYVLIKHHSELWSLNRQELVLGMVSGLFLAIHFSTWISSLEFTSVASSVVIVSTAPLWVALFSPVILKEPVSKYVLIGLFLAFLGGMIVSISDACVIRFWTIQCQQKLGLTSSNSVTGNLLALFGALAGAGYLLIGRKLRQKHSIGVYILLVYGMASVLLILMVFIRGTPIFGYPPEVYLWFIGLAIFPQLIGHTSFNWALGYLPVVIVSISLLGEPVGSTILAYFFLNEIPSTLKVTGALLILVGILLSGKIGTTRSKG